MRFKNILTPEPYITRKMKETNLYLKEKNFLNLLRDLASSTHVFKIELVTSEPFEDQIIRKIGPNFKKNLKDLMNFYERKVKKKASCYSVWIVFHPTVYPFEEPIQFQECEVRLDYVNSRRGLLRYSYLYEDPRIPHSCIFGDEVERKVKSRCRYAGKILDKYLRRIEK